MDTTKSRPEGGQESNLSANHTGNGELIATIERNSIDQIRVAWSDYKGHRFLDIRIHSDYAGDGKHRPTKKGVTIRPEQIPELVAALILTQGVTP